MLEAYQLGEGEGEDPHLLEGPPSKAPLEVSAVEAVDSDSDGSDSKGGGAGGREENECATEEDGLATTRREDGTIALAGEGADSAGGGSAGGSNETVKTYEQEVLYQLEEAVRLDGAFVEARIQLAMFYAHQQNFTASIAQGHVLLEQSPENTMVHWALAVAHHGAGSCEEAMSHYKVIIDAEPDHRNAHFRTAICLQELRKASEAIEHYQEVLRIDPSYAQAHVNWGIALKAQHKRAAAMEHYQIALDLDATCADAHVRWGNVLLEQWMEHRRTADSREGFWNEAMEHFKKALHIDPRYAGLEARVAALVAHKEHKKKDNGGDRDPYHQQQRDRQQEEEEQKQKEEQKQEEEQEQEEQVQQERHRVSWDSIPTRKRSNTRRDSKADKSKG
jgi:tetratricopeptide (TPR) repeat protein